ncbi:hypothetical protein F4810DRAFT_556668 [Camillea tinctor]|nr:hypothetical protein F4810DRAFT_556668 [Camillea tinctor]
MARLPSGALALSAHLPDGTVSLTPWDPVTMNTTKRPFAAFASCVPTPPRPNYFWISPEEKRRREENEAWVARQISLYAAAPGPRYPEWQRKRDLRLRGGKHATEEEEGGAPDIPFLVTLNIFLVAILTAIREHVAETQFWLSGLRYQFDMYFQQPDVRNFMTLLRRILLAVVVLGIAVAWYLWMPREINDEDDNEIVAYVLVENYRSWSVVPPVPDAS